MWRLKTKVKKERALNGFLTPRFTTTQTQTQTQSCKKNRPFSGERESEKEDKIELVFYWTLVSVFSLFCFWFVWDLQFSKKRETKMDEVGSVELPAPPFWKKLVFFPFLSSYLYKAQFSVLLQKIWILCFDFSSTLSLFETLRVLVAMLEVSFVFDSLGLFHCFPNSCH